jgi:uncharacterized protein (DUF885 family)
MQPGRLAHRSRVALLLFWAAVPAGAQPAATAPAGGGRQPAPTAEARLDALYERTWQWRLQEWPTFASQVGEHAYDDRLPDASPAAFARRAERTQRFLDEFDAIDRSGVTGSARVSAEVFRRDLVEDLDAVRFGEHLMPLNADSGFHTGFALLPQSLRFATVADYDNYLARLRAFPAYVDQHIALMREGLARGITVPRPALAGVERGIETLIVDAAERSPLWTPFERFPPAVDAVHQARLRDAARVAVLEAVVPAYRRFLAFMSSEYLPGARSSLAASDHPAGAAYYQFLVRKFTTLDLTPEAVHEIGLREVAAIRAEMNAVIARTGFTGDFAAFLRFLRTDPRFYPATPEQLLKEAAWIAKRMDAKLPSLFGRLPRQPYGVAPVPAYLAPKYTAGRYNGNPRQGTEPGYYWVNTYALDTRPLYNLEALTLHEAVPGHHLQGALAEEMEGVPPFRRYAYISAFGEGWGLYSEWLGLEAGFYTDPYSDFGRLTYAMWRAARLVVDTGLHSQGWTRQQAIDYLAARTALSIHECTTEVDRYISWPGQALAYKIGELRIKQLRARASQALGPKFDLREFHDVVLGSGAIPLDVLEANVAAWQARKAATP